MDFIAKAEKIHGKLYDYSLVNYTNSKTKIIIICRIHGRFEQRPCNHLLGRGCQKCARITITQALRSSTKEFIQKAISIHKNKYDYSKTNYKNSRTKITIICAKHGPFKQTPDNHLNSGGCPTCTAKTRVSSLGTDNFISLATKFHGDLFSYNNTIYKTAQNKVIIICKKHGPFRQLPLRHLKGLIGCPRCTSSKPQNIVAKILEQLNLDIKINNRTAIKPYEIDLYIPDLSFGIEIHGVYYHSYNRLETTKERLQHQQKAILAKDNNITLLQFFEHEIHNINLIKSMILAKIGLSNKIHARKCTIELINHISAKEFFDHNHLQNNRPARHYVGLNYNDKLVACISLSKHKTYSYEIIRLAFARNIIVIGGLEKMLTFFIKTYKPKSIITWADMRISNGICYQRAKFKLIKTSKPNYCYVKSSKIYSRQQFQKHKLNNKLYIFDETLSEPQNMFANGYRRLWDAGHQQLLLLL